MEDPTKFLYKERRTNPADLGVKGHGHFGQKNVKGSNT